MEKCSWDSGIVVMSKLLSNKMRNPTLIPQKCTNRFWGLDNFPSSGYRYFPGVKAAIA
jgi:hypothetical protein